MAGDGIPVPDAWSPLDVDEVAEVLSAVRDHWGYAGGHALEMFAGRRWRAHGDIDIVVFRDDQLAIQAHLLKRDWQLYAADPPGSLRRWHAQESLPIGVHDVWCHRSGANAFQLQIMLQEVDAEHWWYRRDRRIRGPRESFFMNTGVYRHIRPEIQLLYKSGQVTAKDDADFVECLPRLSRQAHEWLRNAMLMTAPRHRWLGELSR